jgi:hypothetical protein
MKRFRVLLWVAPLALAWPPAPAAGEPLPLPRMVVAKTLRPPTIDGKLAPGEWDRAAACTGFVKAFDNTLGSVQSVAWITYDDRYFYVAMKNDRGPGYTLLSKRGRRPDDGRIVFDHANEIWFSPPSTPAETYQTLFNAYPAVYDVKMIPSVGSKAVSWNGHWEIAASETRESWTIEARAPITSFGKPGIRDGDVWQALFTTDVIGGAGFTAWAAGTAFEDIHRHGFLEFREQSPVFQLLDIDSVHTGQVAFKAAAGAAARQGAEIEVTARFGAGVGTAAGDRVLRETVRLAAGEHRAFTLNGSLAGLTLPKKKVLVRQNPEEFKEAPGGYCRIEAKAGGRVLYSQTFPFTIDGLVRTPPAVLKERPYEAPFGVEAFYAPLHRKLVVKVDRLYLARRAEAVGGRARLLDAKTGKLLAERPLAPFAYDVSEFAMDLSGVQVPVETEEAWRQAKAVADENVKRKARGEREQPLPFQPARERLEVSLADAAGHVLATHGIDVPLQGYQFEWLPNNVGISEKVIPPWTPVRVGGKQVSMWNKTYTMNGLGLAEQVVNAGRPQLAGPMQLVATVDGKETVLGAPLEVIRTSEAGVDLAGRTKLPGLGISVESRVEFDGCVLNTLKLRPEARNPSPPTPLRAPTEGWSGARGGLERLSLLVRLPKAETPCFVTTAGGWSAVHGWTPERWDSRETALGSMKFNFVPYVLLTDSERGFCLFVDSVRGWLLDPGEPTVELITQGRERLLRLNLVTRAGAVEQPTSMTFGWMVTPQKPQPRGWRATFITYSKPFAQANVVFYGMDQTNWAVLWPYYASPYPWDYEKSKPAFESARAHGVALCAGNIAHAIARYRDAKDRWFNDLAADWGEIPGNLDNGNVALSRGPNDFRLWHWDQWIRRSGLNGLYFDENYLGEDWNWLSGGAFLLPDEQIHPGYNYLGLREMDKRIRYLFHEHGLDGYHLWLHTTSGQPVYAWMPDVAMEGENVEPVSLENDYLEALPAGRLRAIGMGANLGAAPIIMCQADRHWKDECSPLHVHQFVGWVLAHDCLPESVSFWPPLAAEMQMWQDDYRFLPYWKSGLGIGTKTADVLVSAHVRPGHAVLWIVNTARQPREAAVEVDFGKIGLDPGRTIALDAETGERYECRSGAIRVGVPPRLWRAVRLVERKLLTGSQTFLAHFDRGEAAADESLGYGYPLGDEVPKADMPGKTGRALSLGKQVRFACRQNVFPEEGRIEFQLQADLAKAEGLLLNVGNLDIRCSFGKLQVNLSGKQLAQAPLAAAAGRQWHAARIAWKGSRLEVSVGSMPRLAATLPGGMPIRPMGRGLAIASYHEPRAEPSVLTMGPIAGAAIDDLVMARTAQ